MDVDEAVARMVGDGSPGFAESLTGGDLDGDGFADVVVAAPSASLGLPRGGAAWVLRGGEL